jgi:ABC-type Mn2+/Zn2+ transport system ATPase subunit
MQNRRHLMVMLLWELQYHVIGQLESHNLVLLLANHLLLLLHTIFDNISICNRKLISHLRIDITCQRRSGEDESSHFWIIKY